MMALFNSADVDLDYYYDWMFESCLHDGLTYFG